LATATGRVELTNRWTIFGIHGGNLMAANRPGGGAVFEALIAIMERVEA